jgi:hypothetical protein
MLQNKVFLLFILFSCIAFSQEKKVDTIYVYEEVIIHDTIYIEKPLNKINFEKVVFTKGENDEKGTLEFTQNGKKIEIKVDSTNIIFPKIKIHKKSWFFGGKMHFGYATNSLFKSLNASNTIGFGLGVWTRKQIFDSNFSVGIGLDGLYWSSPFSFDASQNNSAINGYYFTNSNQPILFKSIENKHFEAQIPLQFYYKINKFMPSIGVFGSVSNYKSEFIGSSGSLPLSLDETQSYEAKAFQFGYLAELQYEITKKISVGLNFSSGSSKNLIFSNKNNKNQTFKTNNSFRENKFLVQLVYRL